MEKAQKLAFLNALTEDAFKTEKYSEAYYGLWRQINNIADNFYTLFEVNVILDDNKKTWSEIESYDWGYNKAPGKMPTCKKCGQEAVPNNFYGFWCPGCKAYPTF